MSESALVILALKILSPLLNELIDYLAGRSNKPPAFLLNAPKHLQSEVALARKLKKAQTP